MLKTRRAALLRDRVDQRTGRQLAGHRGDRAEAQREADRGLRPALGRQIDRDERAEAGLYVGDEEIEPVEAAAGGRGRGPSAGSGSLPAQRRRMAGHLRGSRAGGAHTAARDHIGTGRHVRLVFGRGLDLRRESDPAATWRVVTPAGRPAPPVDRDLAAADAEKAAEIDDHRARSAIAIDERRRRPGPDPRRRAPRPCCRESHGIVARAVEQTGGLLRCAAALLFGRASAAVWRRGAPARRIGFGCAGVDGASVSRGSTRQHHGQRRRSRRRAARWASGMPACRCAALAGIDRG